MKLTENTALLVVVVLLMLVIFGGYTAWSDYLRPFLRKIRFLKSKIKTAPNETEKQFWKGELRDFYKRRVPVFRHFVKK